jgi:hypothetical protein
MRIFATAAKVKEITKKNTEMRNTFRWTISANKLRSFCPPCMK